MFVRDLRQLHPSGCPVLQQLRQEYAERRCHYNSGRAGGYIRYTIDGSVLYEHVEVARRMYGDIPAGYHVHHRDENKRNNGGDNLEVIEGGAHSTVHVRQRHAVRQRQEGKAVEAGRTVVVVPPAYTSKTCSGCGALFEHLTLSDRWVECDCGLSLDRDHNAALNILRVGQTLWASTYPVADCVAQEAAGL